MLFGGDLGRYSRPVLPDPSPIDAADILLVESTMAIGFTSPTMAGSGWRRSSARPHKAAAN